MANPPEFRKNALFTQNMTTSQVHTLTVSDGVGQRIDSFIAAHISTLSRSFLGKLVDEGLVAVGGTPVKPSYKVKQGDVISVKIPPSTPTDIFPEEIPLDIVYEDADIVVINKPRGMTTHPAPGAPSGTLVNALLANIGNLSSVGGVERPGIVHRLDKNTTGLLVAAKNDSAHRDLQRQIQDKSAKRRYLALVWGDVSFEKAVVDAPIGRHPNDRKRMAVVTGEGRNRAAFTDLAVVERFVGFTLLEASLRTGRTHQIRVHTAYINHPVLGDPVYGGKRNLPKSYGPRVQADFGRLVDSLGGQALHAWRLSFDHPRTGERKEFEAPLPDDFSAILHWLRSNL